MQIKELLSDDQGVSPVIGVILMVAITVILAAVIGTFVLGLGGNLSQSAPTASFQFDYQKNSPNNDTLTISHAGGDTIQASNLYIKSSAGFHHNGTGSWNGDGSATWASSGEVSAGDTVTINHDDMTTHTVRIVWQSAEGDSSATLGKWSGPEA